MSAGAGDGHSASTLVGLHDLAVANARVRTPTSGDTLAAIRAEARRDGREQRTSAIEEQAVFGAAFAVALDFYRKHVEPEDAAQRAMSTAHDAVDWYRSARQDDDA